MFSKRIIRAVARGVRDSLSPSEADSRSWMVVDNLLSLDIACANSFFVYMSKGREVCTSGLISKLLGAGKTVAVPKVMDSKIMEPYILTRLDQLSAGAYGILEPNTARYEGSIDVCIVPGVIFDARGGRIGQGKGYYDRFLSANDVGISVGMAYSFQVVPKLPLDRNDALLDMIVTESKVFRR